MTAPLEIHTREDLHRALQLLYTGAGVSYHKLAAAAAVTAAPNTIHDWVHGKTFPQWENLAPVLGAWGVSEPGAMRAWKDAHTRASDDSRNRPGVWLAQVRDPFALEVHEPITVAGDGDGAVVLPLYVGRAHDDRLRAVVERALGGQSGIAVLLGDSSTGKTRALWEALGRLRGRGGWRLWHPSSHLEELSEQLERVGPRTVVWLNETQRYFLPRSEQERGRLSEQLRTVLADPRRAPVLIVGSLWHEHYSSLCNDPGSATRKLFGQAVIKVSASFTGADLTAMRTAAQKDPRLKLACKRAEDGRITQYLAGGPELIHFYDNEASATGRAVIQAAMDAVRMGHPNRLPFSLLRDAAAGYLSDAIWDCLEQDWFEAALAETSRSCKGARGPITPIRPRPAGARGQRERPGRGGSAEGEPVFQLADYLDQHGRRTRAHLIPPIGFWEAAVHVHHNHQHTLAQAAWDRGIYRDAIQLWKNATRHGHPRAAHALVRFIHTLFPDDPHPASWAAAHTTLAPAGVAELLSEFRKTGAHEQAQALLARDPAAHVTLDNASNLAQVLRELRKSGAREQMQVVLARNPATYVPLDDPLGLASLLGELRETGAHEQVQVLAVRAAAHAALHDPGRVALLLREFRDAGACEQVQVLLARNPAASATLHSPTTVTWLLHELRMVGAHGQVRALLARDPSTNITLDDPYEVARRLHQLQEAGAQKQIQELLARDPGSQTALTDASGISWLLDQLSEIGAHDQVRVLLARDPATHVAIDDPGAVASLLNQLQEIGAHDQVQVLLARDPAGHTALADAGGLAWLSGELNGIGAHDQVRVLLARDPATHTVLNDQPWVTELLGKFHETEAHEQVEKLSIRLPAAGMFSEFLKISPDREAFRFGLEPHDHTPAQPWAWHDLLE
ncbi:hypothetical protein [Nocardia coubleae]|uniref:Uncharacterized protein n=1 Tax=Nocardia coubleae TaxID=356147 RepID=A0A846W450_9NOCA|nr:hypothetical protein [Nocardia coubleae]NKX88019.1 hypothetical protein [Nocardia coubleae]